MVDKRPRKTPSADLLARARKLLDTPLTYIFHPSFHHPEVAETLQNSPENIAIFPGLYDVPLFVKDEEQLYFQAFHFFKYRADQLRRTLSPHRPAESKVLEIERFLADSVVVRNHILRANLRLVVSLARKFTNQSLPTEELISEGLFPLMRAVELFDYSRGNRFSTYATWAVRNHFLRLLKDEQKFQQRFLQTDPDTIPAEEITESSTADFDGKSRQKRRQVKRLLARLSERERVVVTARFGLTEEAQEQTLSQIGRELGISKERVRQLTLRSLEKLKVLAGKSAREVSCPRSKREHSSSRV